SNGTNIFFDGTVSLGTNEPTDYGTSLNSSTSQPSNNWGKIRQLNVFIQSVRNSPLPSYTKNKFIAQALFFRAYRYFDLVRIYGGVPLVLQPLDAVGDEAKKAALLPRNTTSECMKQIVSDLDTAIAYLPGRWNTTGAWGRITSGAAAAFKGRALLYYASPQFNPNDLPERWQAAYDANLQAKTILDANSFGLNSSYQKLWFTEVNNPEAVMVTGYNNSTGDQTKKNNSWDNSTRPKYLGTSGGSNQPSWEMVKAYPMKDGKMPGDPTSKYTYSDQLFYKNRDPRFDATIAYNGCTWPINGNANYKLWTYYETSSKSTEQNATSTGFYCRKAIGESTYPSNDPQYCGTDWIEIRYAEVLLNLAESAIGINKLGVADESYSGIIAVRKRAGIEPGADNLYGLTAGMSRSDLFKAVLFERQIEFAFEGKRFWDLRRWKLFESTLNGWKRNKIKITLNSGASVPSATDFKNPSSPKFRDVTDLDYAYTNYFTVTVNNNPLVTNSTTTLDTKPINWQSTYYFFPIPQAAITNDPNLQQNNNWGGPFDPLK
ncbi:MAG TPA: RagB/SusD family nutrient uptake outer membrane protein, partial [Flavisolibacter sp.]|nr:RagB/SusD family nutrient uptake outer membrane protein [Flavisolibacter sp.]